MAKKKSKLDKVIKSVEDFISPKIIGFLYRKINE